MKCLCGAYANPKWQSCLVCGELLLHDSLLGFSLTEIQQAAGNDWEMLKTSPAMLKAFIAAKAVVEQRQAGKTPAHYTAKTYCKQCGEVPIPPALVNDGYVLGCPWCFTRPQTCT